MRIKSHLILAVTSIQVCKQLIEKEEAEAVRLGKIGVHNISPSALIHRGMKLKEYQ
jgi:hypothetical protein